MRLTITLAGNGLSREVSHSASASRRPDVRPSAGGSSVGGFPSVITLRKPGLVGYALLSGSPRIRKYDVGPYSSLCRVPTRGISRLPHTQVRISDKRPCYSLRSPSLRCANRHR